MARAAPPEPRAGSRLGRGLLFAGLLAVALGVLLLVAAAVFGAVGLMLGPLVALVGIIAVAAGLAASRGPRPA